jgi:sarcosine oxidase
MFPHPHLALSPQTLPVYIWDTGLNQDIFYGFPMQSGHPLDAVKVAVHITEGNICSPETINRIVSPDEIRHIQSLLSSYLPSLGSGELVETATCLYTLTPDEHL